MRIERFAPSRQSRRPSRSRSYRPSLERLENRNLLVAPDVVKFDFGTTGSEVAAGMTQITPGSVLTQTNDWGFDAAQSTSRTGVNRNGYWGPHSRDFVEADVMTFSIRLHAGATYRVVYGSGDPLTSRSQNVAIDGQYVETVNLQPFDFYRAVQVVEISEDGLLEFEVSSRTADPAILNMLIVTLVSMPGDPPDPPTNDGYLLDFGSAASAIQAGMERVTPTTEFTANTDFGFNLAQSIGLAGRNRTGYWGDHSRDFVEGDRLFFSMRVDPSESYRLRFGFGDPLRSRSQNITLEGQFVERRDFQEGQFYISEYDTPVSSDGILDVRMQAVGSELGLVNFVIVTPSDNNPPGGGGSCDTTGSLETEGNDPPLWMDAFPDSNAPTFDTANHPITCSDQYVAGSNWNGLDERQVFDRRYSVQAPDPQRNYEYRLGEGSQLYSLRMRNSAGQWVETIGTQGLSPSGSQRSSEWVDEVIQTVIVDQELNNPSSPSTKNQIHQSGTYRNLSQYPTFYSPVVAKSWQADERTQASISWPQQAHIPSNYKSHFALMQQVRDLGSGVLEVTYVYHNFSREGEKATFLASPWLPLRDSVLPYHFRSVPGGTIQRDQNTWCAGSGCPPQAVAIESTDGFFIFSSGTGADDSAVAIVFGTDDNDQGQTSRTNFRWGTVTNSSRDLMAASLQKKVRIEPGEIFYHRFYLIANSLRNTRIFSQQLKDHVNQGFMNPDPTLPTDACFALNNGEIEGTSCSSGNVLFSTSTVPREGWRPLLAVTDSSGDRVFTDDPYLLGRRPYQRQYEVEDILGWVSPEAADALASHPDPDVADMFLL